LIRIKKIAVLLGFFCFSLVNPVIFAQTLPMVRIYIAPMETGSPEEREYFMTNMKMEFVGASYEVVDALEDSDYNVVLSVSQQEPWEDTQAEGGNSEPPGNTVTLTLLDTKTKRELITLSWDYQQVSDMDMWNLYLITQAMANAPIAKIPAGTRTAESPAKPVPDLRNKLLWAGIEIPLGYTYPDDGPYISPLLAVEYNFLSFLGVSAGAGCQVLFPLVIDKYDYYMTYYHAVQYSFFTQLLFRFLISSEDYLVIPYIGAEWKLGTLDLLPKHALQETDPVWYIPAITGTGGIDFRLSAGPGALDLGIRVSCDIYGFDKRGLSVGFTVGYKFGFLTRTKRDPVKE
jgi:hypothetical protein